MVVYSDDILTEFLKGFYLLYGLDFYMDINFEYPWYTTKFQGYSSQRVLHKCI